MCLKTITSTIRFDILNLMLNLPFLPVKLLLKALSALNLKVLLLLIFIAPLGGVYYFYNLNLKNKTENASLLTIQSELKKQLEEVKNTDQIKRNDNLEKEIKNIHDTYLKSSETFEKIVSFSGKQKADLDKDYAKALKLLSDKNYDEAKKTLDSITKIIDEENAKKIPASAPAAIVNAPVNNTPPSSGFSQQKVHIDSGDFLVSIVSADLSSTRVIVDTASNEDCRDNCPVLSLQDYVSRNGAYAGINGSFFCPATYPSCAGKTNSFDTLLMNKDKKYFNSDNNVYSTIPAVIFQAGSVRFVGRSMDWGRDTGIDSMIANYPLYISGGNVQFTSNGDPKIDSRGARTFVANKDNMIYIGIVYGVSAGQAAEVLKAMGMQNALGMDQGGSTALWSGGYKAGPGRGIPNAILFVRK